MYDTRKSRAKNIYYLNKMCINQNHTHKGDWRMSDIQDSIKTPTGKEGRFIC
jgi:hypothetical protein